MTCCKLESFPAPTPTNSLVKESAIDYPIWSVATFILKDLTPSEGSQRKVTCFSKFVYMYQKITLERARSSHVNWSGQPVANCLERRCTLISQQYLYAHYNSISGLFDFVFITHVSARALRVEWDGKTP